MGDTIRDVISLFVHPCLRILPLCSLPASSSVQERAAIESDAEPYILPELRTIRDSTEGAEPQRSLTSNAPAAPNHTPDTHAGLYHEPNPGLQTNSHLKRSWQTRAYLPCGRNNSRITNSAAASGARTASSPDAQPTSDLQGQRTTSASSPCVFSAAIAARLQLEGDERAVLLDRNCILY